MKGRAVLTKLITSFNYILAAKTKNWKILIFYRRIEKKKKNEMPCLLSISNNQGWKRRA